jgi:quercetin dioxygenase-like cupin family protein
VIDRRLVPWTGQGGISVAVLLDESNSGNDAASILELAIDAGKTTSARQPDRTELWYFLTPARIVTSNKTVAAGDMLLVPKGAIRDLASTGQPARAVVFLLPGGREGSARAGAMPAPLPSSSRGTPALKLLPAASAKTYGPAQIFAEPATTTDKTFSASVLTLAAGASVPEHVHANETELLYVLSGSGTMTVKGVEMAIVPTSVVQVPPNTKHAFKAAAEVRAVQIYTPAGPEQRFKATK